MDKKLTYDAVLDQIKKYGKIANIWGLSRDLTFGFYSFNKDEFVEILDELEKKEDIEVYLRAGGLPIRFGLKNVKKK